MKIRALSVPLPISAYFGRAVRKGGSTKPFARHQAIELGTYVGHAAHDGQVLGRAFALAQNTHGAGRLNAGARCSWWTRATSRCNPNPLQRCSACAAGACGRAAQAAQVDGAHSSGRCFARRMAALVCRFTPEGATERDKGQRQAREMAKRSLHVKLPWARVEHRQDSNEESRRFRCEPVLPSAQPRNETDRPAGRAAVKPLAFTHRRDGGTAARQTPATCSAWNNG